MDTGPFFDQVVIVTGASSGIGRSLSLQLAGQGAKVVLAARRKDLLSQVAGECHQRGGKTVVVPTDVADEIQCRVLIEKTVSEFGRIDMLINNAGLAILSLFDDFNDLQLFKHAMNVNFYGAVYCTFFALPHIKRSNGRLVIVSSLGGKTAAPYNSPYCSGKYALQGFGDTLRMEVKRYGVSVTVVCPSWVVSGFHEAQMDKNGIPQGSRGRAIYKKGMMTSDRCAEIILAAAHKRRREVLMNPGWLAVLLKLTAPGLLDWLSVKLVLEPAAGRAKSGKIVV